MTNTILLILIGITAVAFFILALAGSTVSAWYVVPWVIFAFFDQLEKTRK